MFSNLTAAFVLMAVLAALAWSNDPKSVAPCCADKCHASTLEGEIAYCPNRDR